MLDARAHTLLKSLIERYIADGVPMGSRALSKISGLELSPATIRNVMADLEELGLIASPHTSAGRVPTPRGYRVFVDTLLTAQHGVAHSALMQNGANNSAGKVANSTITPDQPQHMMNQAAQLLSNLSQFAGVVLTPRKTQVFKQLEFLRLSAKKILLIIVAPDGDVQNRILFTQQDYTAAQLIETGNYINQHYAGLDFETLRVRLKTELVHLKDSINQLMQAAVSASSHTAQGAGVVIAGERNLLGIQDLSANMQALRELFDMFEQKSSLMQLLEASHHAQGVQIFIGGDSDLVPVEAMSVVTAPYSVDGQVVGTLGVIGPTRMAYDRVIPIVDITAKLLSNALSQTL